MKQKRNKKPTLKDIENVKMDLDTCRSLFGLIKKLEDVTSINEEINNFSLIAELETLFNETQKDSIKLNQLKNLGNYVYQLNNIEVNNEIETLLIETQQLNKMNVVRNMLENINKIDDELTSLAEKLDGESCPVCGNKIII